MILVPKSTAMRAFHMTRYQIEMANDWPEWLVRARKNQNASGCYLYPEFEDGDFTYVLKKKEMQQEVPWGSYLVINDKEEISVYSERDAIKNFMIAGNLGEVDEEYTVTGGTMQRFRDSGMLLEANRQFFHPIGMEMSVVCDQDGNVKRFGGFRAIPADEPPVRFGDIPPEVFPKWQRKVDNIAAIREARRAKREEAFGSVVEPLTKMEVPDAL